MIVSELLHNLQPWLIGIIVFLLSIWVWNRLHVWIFIWRFPKKITLLDLFKVLRNFTNALSVVEGFFEKSGAQTMFLWLGWYPVLITRDPVIAEKVLTSPDALNKAYPMYEGMKDALGNSILTSSELEWQCHRKWISASFRHKVLVSFFPVLNRAKNKLIDDCNKLIDGRSHNIFKVIQWNIFNAGYETLTGKEVDNKNHEVERFLNVFSYLIRISTVQIFLAYFKLQRLLIFNRKYTEDFCFGKAFIEKRVRTIAENEHIFPNKTEYCDQNSNTDSELHSEKKEAAPIFLNRILQLFKERKFSWSDVSNEANTLINAAVETIANALHSSIILLAMHPTVQERLNKEICSVFSGECTDMEYEHLDKLPYLDMVVQEVLRLLPPIPMIGRQFKKSLQVSENLCIPKGLQIMISIYLIQRRKDIWGPDADKFDPDRFSKYNKAGRHPYAYLPFSKGVRDCIGWRYANFSLKTMLTGLIRNYRFETDFKYENLKIVNTIALSFDEEPEIKIYRRV